MSDFWMSSVDTVELENAEEREKTLDRLYKEISREENEAVKATRLEEIKEVKKIKGEYLGVFNTPVVQPKHGVVSIEETSFGRKFRIPASVFGMCTALESMTSFEQEETEHVEGEVDHERVCNSAPFHYLYCKSAIDWLVWFSENTGSTQEERDDKLREITKQNHENFMTSLYPEEIVLYKARLNAGFDLQRERCERADGIEPFERFTQLMELSHFVGNEDLYQTSGRCFGKMVKGFTPKDFRILNNFDDIGEERKKKIVEDYHWLAIVDPVIN